MRNYRVNLIGLNVTVSDVPMQPDANWTAAAKAAIEMGCGIFDPIDGSYMTVEEVKEAAIDSHWPKVVGVAYDRDLDTAKQLFELLNQVDADVRLDILFTPAEGISENEIAGLLSTCQIKTFSVEKIIGEQTGLLYLEFDRISTNSATQIFATEVEKRLQAQVD